MLRKYLIRDERALSVANSQSGGDREPEQPLAVPPTAVVIQRGGSGTECAGSLSAWRTAAVTKSIRETRMNSKSSSHNATIIGQFSRQAVPFAALPGHSDSIQMLVEMCCIKGVETVLDVACGPGLVACVFARHAKHVSGIDITPKMIEEATARQISNGLTNMDWKIGDITRLPFEDASFSVVVTRYSFHHLLDPKAALVEMIRVCKPGGKVLVADVVQPPEKAEAYDALEILRDPSHVHALTYPEMEAIVLQSGLVRVKTARYKVDGEVEKQLGASFPNLGDEEKIRNLFKADLERDRLGIDVRLSGGEIHFSVPILVLVGEKPA